MHVKRHRTSTSEKIRNILLIVLAVVMVFVFFNLNISREGDSVFNKSASKKLRFTGDLKSKDYTSKEIQKLTAFIEKYNKDIEQTKVSVSLQDSYKKVKDSSQLTFELEMRMKEGGTINSPAWRTTRGKLVSSVLTKMSKDIKVYLSLKKQGKKMKSLVNTK